MLKARLVETTKSDRRGNQLATEFMIKTSRGAAAHIRQVSRGPAYWGEQIIKEATNWQWALSSGRKGDTVATLADALIQIESAADVTIVNVAEWVEVL